MRLDRIRPLIQNVQESGEHLERLPWLGEMYNDLPPADARQMADAIMDYLVVLGQASAKEKAAAGLGDAKLTLINATQDALEILEKRHGREIKDPLAEEAGRFEKAAQLADQLDAYWREKFDAARRKSTHVSYRA